MHAMLEAITNSVHVANQTAMNTAKNNYGSSENNPEKEAFIEKRTDDEIDEMIGRIHMEEELK